jgi:hypothetical protein
VLDAGHMSVSQAQEERLWFVRCTHGGLGRSLHSALPAQPFSVQPSWIWNGRTGRVVLIANAVAGGSMNQEESGEY